MKFKKGDHVRLSQVRGVFDKRYEQTFTDEIFTIDQCIPRDPPVCKIKDYDGELIICGFYEHEPQKINVVVGKLYHIESILTKCKQRGQMYFLSNGETGLKSLIAGLKPVTLKT